MKNPKIKGAALHAASISSQPFKPKHMTISTIAAIEAAGAKKYKLGAHEIALLDIAIQTFITDQEFMNTLQSSGNSDVQRSGPLKVAIAWDQLNKTARKLQAALTFFSNNDRLLELVFRKQKNGAAILTASSKSIRSIVEITAQPLSSPFRLQGREKQISTIPLVKLALEALIVLAACGVPLTKSKSGRSHWERMLARSIRRDHQGWAG